MARLLKRSGLLIQHIPRTGGTWIECVLEDMEISVNRWLCKQPGWFPKKHSLLNHYFRESMNQVRYIAAFVRHPADWYESIWKWFNHTGPRDFHKMENWWRWHPKRKVARLFDKQFNVWVRRVLEEEPMFCTRTFELYVGPDGGEFCDFIGRTESLKEDFIELLWGFGYRDEVNAHMDNLLSSKPRNVRKDPVSWDPGLLRLLEDQERPTIQRFYNSQNKKWFCTGSS